MPAQSGPAIEVEARGFALRVPGNPVYDEDARDYGTLLLCEEMEIGPSDEVLVVGGGSGLVALVAARLASTGRVRVLCGQEMAARQVEAAARLNAVTNVEVVRAGDLTSLREARFDVALVQVALEPSAPVLYHHMAQAAHLLKPGGRLCLTGGKREGILSAAARLESFVGGSQVISYRKGHRVVCATRQGEIAAPWEAPPERVEEVELRGRTYHLGLREGVFAGGALDEGTRLLAETLQVRLRDTVLDLGCGSGLIGLVAAGLAPEGHVHLVDSDYAAVELARSNLERNGVTNASVLASDGFTAIEDLRFDLIATNPPFHVGRIQTTALAQRFVEDSARHLKRGGRFFLVANRFLRYEGVVEAAFGNVQTVAVTSKYKVLFAEWRRRDDGRRGSAKE